MVNGEDTSDVPGSEEHTNALGVLSTSLSEAIPDGDSIIPSRDDEEHDDGASSSIESLTKAIPDQIVAQAGERIVAGRANVGDGQAPAQLNLTIGGLAAVVVGAHTAAVVPAGVVGADNAGVVPAGVVGADNAGVVPAGQAPAQINHGGAAAMVAPPPLPAPPHFDIEAGLSGLPLRRSEAGPFF